MQPSFRRQFPGRCKHSRIYVAWKGKDFEEFKFNVDKDSKVRVTLKANLDGDWGEVFKLCRTGNFESGTNVTAAVHKKYNEYGRWDGTCYFESDLESRFDYYILSKDDGSSFSILNVEYL